MKKIAQCVLVALSCAVIGASSGTPPDSRVDRGNQLIAKGDFAAAENLFREALIADPESTVYRNQLALCLLQQKKYEDAERELDRVLQGHPEDTAALWYKAQNSFTAEKYREAVPRLRSVLQRLDKASPQYYAAFWFLATSWKSVLLQPFESVTSELQRAPGEAEAGLGQDEVDEMLNAYRKYLELQPKAPDKVEIKKFLRWVKKNRPPSNVRRWLVASPPQ